MTFLKIAFRSFVIAVALILLALSFGFSSSVEADSSVPTLYVSPDGNDTSGNGTKDAPYLTLKKAFSKIDGDVGATVVIMGGVESTNGYAWLMRTAGFHDIPLS